MVYYVCDDLNEIPSGNHNIPSQEYRSRLFSLMFERYLNVHNTIEATDTPVVIRAVIHEASVGRHRITAREWQQLLAAVDQFYPDFKDALVMRTESLSEEQMKFCYLLRIGLSNPQIQNVTDMSRATVWRWSKKYEDVVK